MKGCLEMLLIVAALEILYCPTDSRRSTTIIDIKVMGE
jgi:hypothetical protein